MQKRAPALLDNLVQAFLMAPFFVLLEVNLCSAVGLLATLLLSWMDNMTTHDNLVCFRFFTHLAGMNHILASTTR
jgi:uncharacterized membrane protein YGL010W